MLSEEIKPTDSKLSITEGSETKKTSERAENEKTDSTPVGRPEKVMAKVRKERPAPIESAWRKGPPKATHITKDGLSAFAPPYSAKPVSVGNGGELQQAQVAHSPAPMIQAPTVNSSVTKAEPRSVWAKGPPAIIKTVVVPSPRFEGEIQDENQTRSQATSQEVEIEPPTPSFSHLMPPTSAWTVYSTDSDPAGPWDPAVRRQQSLDIPPIPQHYKHHQKEMDAAYPWGMPMMPVPMVGYEGQAPQYPGGAGVLWTPNGWAVQDAAMKRALNVAEKAVRLGGNVKLKARGNKSNYRSESKPFAEVNSADMTNNQNDHADSLLKATALMVINAPSEFPPFRGYGVANGLAYMSCLPPINPKIRAPTPTRQLPLQRPPRPLEPLLSLANFSTRSPDVSTASRVRSSTPSSSQLAPTQSSDHAHGELAHADTSN
jgi:hypothetical protein